MEKFPNTHCFKHEWKPMACYCPDCVEVLCSECAYYHTLHLKHRPVPSVFIKFMPAFLLLKINRCVKHNAKPEFYSSNHGSLCCKRYAKDIHGCCGNGSATGSTKSIELRGEKIFKVNAGDMTGCTRLPSGQMMFIDNKYDSLVVHEKDGSLNRTINLLSKPYSIACINDSSVAVTQDKEVIIINLETDLTEKWIDVGSQCLDICCNDMTLVVTLANDEGVCLLDVTGNILKRIKVPVCGMSSAYLSKDRLYMLEFHNEHLVYCCHTDGNIIWTFHRKGLRGPRQIQADINGFVYVVYETSMKVLVISSDGKGFKVLLCEQDGLHFPKTIYLSLDSNQLLVCNSVSCTALLYSVTKSQIQKQQTSYFLRTLIILSFLCALFFAFWLSK